jgi:hypothetical protein
LKRISSAVLAFPLLTIASEKRVNLAMAPKGLLRIFIRFALITLVISISHASWVSATTECDKALVYLIKGKNAAQIRNAFKHYEHAIDLCPGFIRPYELLGNLHRKAARREKAIALFKKAAELGTANYKLYYLLADLLFQKGELDEAARYVKKSLNIRADYPKSLALMKQIQGATDCEGPRIILFEPSTDRGLKIAHQFENLTVRGFATDKSGVSWIEVNRQEATLDEHGNFFKDIPIQMGTNVIVVEGSDTLGNRSKITVTVEGEEYRLPVTSKIGPTPGMDSLYDKSIAVVIGIDHYEKWPSLEFAVSDAMAVRRKLQSTGFHQVTTILDRDATQRRILTELFHELPKEVGPNDRVLFFFAGHGQTEDLPDGGKKGYVIPVDADDINFTSSAISMEQIRALSSRIRAKHILYVMDSCYSGLGFNRSPGVSPKISDYLRKVSSMRVVQIITAGGKGEQVQEREGHGLFTAHFLRALEGEADINKDWVVTGTELGAYLRPTVSNASQQAQTPLFGRLEGEGEFLFFVGGK